MKTWQPSEGIKPTTELMNVIHSDNSIAVLASAGSGKTELLAQKASYLFFTEKCSWPKRILSLTFKTEAKANIKKRVNKRCGQDANRFDSFTFHAFCKSIVDRFKNALPESKRPDDGYDIVFKKKDADGKKHILMANLCQLAIDILQGKPEINALFAYSYSHVFVDEFQDTTDEQYQLLTLLFKNTQTKILVVGDINQSIMLWAGAKKRIFENFIEDFSAQRTFLQNNFRASEEIETVLKVFLRFVNNPAEIIDKIQIKPINCHLHFFANEIQEASFLAHEIAEKIARGVKAHDICVLTKQLSDQYTEKLRLELTRLNIQYLDMSDLQDALKEPLGELFTLCLKALVNPKATIMTRLFEFNFVLYRIDNDDEKAEQLTHSLAEFLVSRRSLINDQTTIDELIGYLKDVINQFDKEKIKGRWKQYQSNDYFDHVWLVLETELRKIARQTKSLNEAIALFDQENAVHIMNIHKCKGLEYDSVYFIGLEDQAFWNYQNEIFENNCAIYVALSRAKTSINVTRCRQRDSRKGKRYSYFDKVNPVIKLLSEKCGFADHKHW